MRGMKGTEGMVKNSKGKAIYTPRGKKSRLNAGKGNRKSKGGGEKTKEREF